MGSREKYFAGLKDGSIDLIPEYTGVLLQYINKAATETSPDEVYAALKKALPGNLTVLDKAAAEDKDAVVVTKETADKWSLKSIDDLKAALRRGHLRWPAGVRDPRRTACPASRRTTTARSRSFRLAGRRAADDRRSADDGTVQAADIFTTDAAIKANNLVVLEDPKNNFAAQNVVPLINTAKASDGSSRPSNAISAKLDTKTLIDLQRKLNAPDKPDAAKVAADWLASAGIK